MCMIALRLEVVILPHRCTPSCYGPSPLDELAARLRAEGIAAGTLAADLAEGVPVVIGDSPLSGVAARRAVSVLARIARVPALAGELPGAASALQSAFDPAAPASAHTVRAWASVRCTAPDRLPLVGPVNATALPGLWVCTAMGARGLTRAVLCGELLAARLHGEPLPLEARLAQTLATERL